MTDTEINKAIAEWCGWIKCEAMAHSVVWWGRWEAGNPNPVLTSTAPPNFVEDLNACHEAEKKLFGLLIRGFDASGIYWNALTNVAGKRIWHATARQRCEALLRVLGKWKE